MEFIRLVDGSTNEKKTFLNETFVQHRQFKEINNYLLFECLQWKRVIRFEWMTLIDWISCLFFFTNRLFRSSREKRREKQLFYSPNHSIFFVIQIFRWSVGIGRDAHRWDPSLVNLKQ